MNLSIIEQAMKAEMNAQVLANKWGFVREIKSYGGEFDEDLDAVIRAFPAIWVTFEGAKPTKLSHNKYRFDATFVVLVGARSVRNEEAQRHGAGADIGTYQMLEYVQQLLGGNDLSSQSLKGLAPLELGRVKTIFNSSTRGQSISVLAQELHTQFVVVASDRDREAAEAVDMHSIKIDYFYEQVGDLNASDLIELEHD